MHQAADVGAGKIVAPRFLLRTTDRAPCRTREHAKSSRATGATSVSADLPRVMPIASYSNPLLRRLRDLLVLLLALGHFSVTVLHSAHVDQPALSKPTETILSKVWLEGSTGSDDPALTERHCHVCFSVSPIRAEMAWSLIAIAARPFSLPTKELTGASPPMDTPPPKV